MPDKTRRSFVKTLGAGLLTAAAASGTASAAKFSDGQRVKTTADLSIRTGPATYYDRKTVVPEGAAGSVRAGPRESYGYTWYKIAYNAGYVGWSAANWLTPAPNHTFELHESVYARGALHTYHRPRLHSRIVETISAGSNAEIVNGPVQADGYTWWGLHWTGPHVWGWTIERYLKSGARSSDRGGTEPRSDFSWPVSGPITSDYYDQRSDGHHSSIDIAADRWTEIGAARAGTVSNVLTLGAGGRSVFVDHSAGYQTRYMHAIDWAVSEGDRVDRGETIAYVGSTGHSTGPHLHFEVERYGTNQYLPGDEGEYVSEGDPIDQDYSGL
jgi:uncharacterized protein YraI